MDLRTMLRAAEIHYGYDADDKAIIRRLAMEDRDGLQKALEADPMLEWVAKDNGLIGKDIA